MGVDYRVRCCPDGLMTDRRRNVRVLDCTVRDGGICNQWMFSHELVRDHLRAMGEAGVDLVELGYWTDRDIVKTEVGPWRFCEERDLEQVVEEGAPPIGVMVDIGRYDVKTMQPKALSHVSLVRVAAYARDVDKAIAILERAGELGYDTACNVMAVTQNTPDEVDGFLDRLARSGVETVNIVDSYGAMYPHQLRYLIRKYKNWLRPSQRVGVHLHNNQQTAFANSIVAVEEGVDLVDATVFGMGRGAGNCPLELLLMYLDDEHHKVPPVLRMVDRLAPLRETLKWGYEIPYAVTGWLNQHPRAAMARIKEPVSDSVAFFEEQTVELPGPRHHRPRFTES